MNASAPPFQESKPSTLDEAAIRFTVEPRHSELLERHRNAVLQLRARGASTTQIHELLQQYAILVSESAIIRFCRKHRAESQRLRQEITQSAAPVTQPASSPRPPVASPALSTPTPTTNPTAPKGQKHTDLRGEF